MRVWKRNGYSMCQFAEDYGVVPSAVSQVFSGKSAGEPLWRTASAVARYMLRREELVERVERKTA